MCVSIEYTENKCTEKVEQPNNPKQKIDRKKETYEIIFSSPIYAHLSMTLCYDLCQLAALFHSFNMIETMDDAIGKFASVCGRYIIHLFVLNMFSFCCLNSMTKRKRSIHFTECKSKKIKNNFEKIVKSVFFNFSLINYINVGFSNKYLSSAKFWYIFIAF